VGALLQELVQTRIYKRTQGRVTRQVTFAAMAVVLALGMWRLQQTLMNWQFSPTLRFGIPSLILMAGLWVAFRLVNVSAVADFLIAVEAEMSKVSWPSRSELIRASLVVLITIFVLAAVLALYDFAWQYLFRQLGVL